jgi:NHL repeat
MGSSALQGKLQVPHSLALDTCANAIYVADRGAAAVRRFNIAGEFAGANHRDMLCSHHV